MSSYAELFPSLMKMQQTQQQAQQQAQHKAQQQVSPPLLQAPLSLQFPQVQQAPQPSQTLDSRNFNNEFMKSYMQLNQNYMTLQNSYLQIHQKNSELQAELIKFKNTTTNEPKLLDLNQELVGISNNLLASNEDLKMKLAIESQKVRKYESDIQKLNIEITTLKTNSQPMNYEFLAENDRLKEQINILEQDIRKLSEKLYDSEDMVNKFKKSNHFWVVNICNFMTKYGLAKYNAEIREILSQIKDDYSRTGAFVERLKIILNEQKKVMLPFAPK